MSSTDDAIPISSCIASTPNRAAFARRIWSILIAKAEGQSFHRFTISICRCVKSVEEIPRALLADGGCYGRVLHSYYTVQRIEAAPQPIDIVRHDDRNLFVGAVGNSRDMRCRDHIREREVGIT